MLRELREHIVSDLPASIVVFLVALPLCLGIALASGAPLASGLIAGAIGGIVAGFLSKSSLAVSGPAAGLTTIVLSSIQDLGSFPAFLACVVVAGLLQIGLGYARAGVVGHFFPISVIKGMLAAIGLILILKQIPHALGYDADYEGDESFIQPDGQNTFTEILQAIRHPTPGAIVVSTISLLIILFWETPRIKRKNWAKYVSGALVVVLIGILLNQAFILWYPEISIQATHLVNLPDFSATSLSSILTFPDFSQLLSQKSLVIAVTLAMVASLESLLSVEATDRMDPYKRITPLDRELKAQGVANIVSGLLGGLPVTAVIVRSTANIAAGARSKWSAIFHGAILIVVVFSFPRILQLIPLACLAGILIMVGYKLTSPSMYLDMWKRGRDQFLPFVVTILAILLSDLLVGIFVGMMVALYFVLKTNFHSAVVLVNDENQYLLKFTRDVSFLNKAALRRALEKIPDNARIIIDGSRSHFIDSDVVETIQDFMKTAETKNIEVELKRNRHATHPMFRESE
ncbi:MAG: SulP family inorganic anion transporter [Cyclobacteriaceae bacterium]|jgi:MFS superfamily sulfate permease-like transporter